MGEKKAPQWAIDQAERVAGIDGDKRHVIITNGVIGIHTTRFIEARKLRDAILYSSKEGA